MVVFSVSAFIERAGIIRKPLAFFGRNSMIFFLVHCVDVAWKVFWDIFSNQFANGIVRCLTDIVVFLIVMLVIKLISLRRTK